MCVTPWTSVLQLAFVHQALFLDVHGRTADAAAVSCDLFVLQLDALHAAGQYRHRRIVYRLIVVVHGRTDPVRVDGTGCLDLYICWYLSVYVDGWPRLGLIGHDMTYCVPPGTINPFSVHEKPSHGLQRGSNLPTGGHICPLVVANRSTIGYNVSLIDLLSSLLFILWYPFGCKW